MYLLNGLQQCSSLQSRRKQKWRLLVLILRKITKWIIHLRFAVCSVRHPVNAHTPAVLQWTFQVLYLLHKVLHSGRHHVTFCCSKQLHHTFLLSSLTRPRSVFPQHIVGGYVTIHGSFSSSRCSFFVFVFFLIRVFSVPVPSGYCKYTIMKET